MAIAAIGLGAPLASADSTITVQDPSFETPVGQNGVWAQIASVWNSNIGSYAQTNDNTRFATRTDAGTWYANLTDPGDYRITQNFSTTVTSGDTLAVTFYVGRELGQVGGIMAATFLVDGTPYTQNFDATGLPAGTWQSYTLTKTIGNTGTGNLSLKFNRVSGRPWLDNISDVTVTPAPPPNGEPTSINATLNAVEDTQIALAAENFGYADPNLPPSPLAAVKITSLPLLGTLKNDGAIVLSGELPLTVAAADIGKLTYQSALNGNGTSYTTIGIKVKNASDLWSIADAVMTVNVTPVNDPPTSTGGSVSMKANTVKTFAAANFQFSDVDTGDTLQAIMVTSLPLNGGTLKLNGTPITSAPSAEILVADIGTLTYTPVTDYSGSDSFDFKVSDGTALSTSAATMAITITVNQVPTSTGSSVILRANTVKTFAAADFPFADGDVGDTLQAIKVTSLPANGTLSVAVDTVIPVADIGTLTYTPNTDYTGSAPFNFQVSDGTDFSADATMAITVTPDILVLNGSFEYPTPHNPHNGAPDNSDWTAGGWAFLPAPWTSSYGLNYSRISYAAMIGTAQPGPWICNLNGSGIWIKQDLGSSVNAGDTLSVTFQLMSDNLPGEVTAEFQVGTGPTPTVYSQTFTSPQNNGTWVTYTLTKTVEAGVSGNLVLKLTNTGGAGVNDRSWIDNISNVSVTTGSGSGSFAAWATTNGAGSQTMAQDHDNDGVSNGIEYFLGGNTNTTGFTALPGVVNTAGTLSVTWIKAAGYTGVYPTDYVVQTSTTLIGDWTDETTDPGDVTITGTEVKYTFPSVGPVKFARLKVMGP
jgi:hypothetical protein